MMRPDSQGDERPAGQARLGDLRAPCSAQTGGFPGD